MNDIKDLSDTIIAKSDQLNADDLIGADKVIKITNVRRGGENDPVIINYEGDDGRPFKPCKTMRRVLVFAWGKDGTKWIGRHMRLYRDEKVTWAGEEVGGIRISHLSDIDKQITVSLAKSRSKKSMYTIDKLEPKAKPPYPFEKGFPKMKASIESGEMTPEQVITVCEEKGTLTEEQRKAIRAVESVDDVDNPFGG